MARMGGELVLILEKVYSWDRRRPRRHAAKLYSLHADVDVGGPRVSRPLQ